MQKIAKICIDAVVDGTNALQHGLTSAPITDVPLYHLAKRSSTGPPLSATGIADPQKLRTASAMIDVLKIWLQTAAPRPITIESPCLKRRRKSDHFVLMVGDIEALASGRAILCTDTQHVFDAVVTEKFNVEVRRPQYAFGWTSTTSSRKQRVLSSDEVSVQLLKLWHAKKENEPRSQYTIACARLAEELTKRTLGLPLDEMSADAVLDHGLHRMRSRSKKTLHCYTNPSLPDRIRDRTYKPRHFFRWEVLDNHRVLPSVQKALLELPSPVMEDWQFAQHLQKLFTDCSLKPAIEYAGKFTTKPDAALVRNLAADEFAWSADLQKAWHLKIVPVQMYRWANEPAAPAYEYNQHIAALGPLPDTSRCFTAVEMANFLSSHFNLKQNVTADDVKHLANDNVDLIDNEAFKKKYKEHQYYLCRANGIGGILKCN